MITFTLNTGLLTASGFPLPLNDWLTRYATPERRLYVGTDSQQALGVTRFTTAIAVHEPGHGGTYAYIRFEERRIESLRERLQAEAWRSLELALLVSQQLPGRSIIVHLDVNSDLRHRSGLFAPGLIGMVRAQGFAAEIKPRAFTASSLADALVRG
jgi:uncharacterized protein